MFGDWDAVAALVLCGPFKARDVLVEGRQIVEGGVLSTVDLPPIVERANALAKGLAS